MLIGQKETTIDEKGRVTIPSLFRDDFKTPKGFVSIGLDKCLTVYPEEVYQKKADKIISLNDMNEVARRVQRTFLSNTFPIEVDSHNRILVPKFLSKKVGITKQIVLIGMYDHLEIWDIDKYTEKAEQEEKSYCDDAQQLIV